MALTLAPAAVATALLSGGLSWAVAFGYRDAHTNLFTREETLVFTAVATGAALLGVAASAMIGVGLTSYHRRERMASRTVLWLAIVLVGLLLPGAARGRVAPRGHRRFPDRRSPSDRVFHVKQWMRCRRASTPMFHVEQWARTEGDLAGAAERRATQRLPDPGGRGLPGDPRAHVPRETLNRCLTLGAPGEHHGDRA